MRLLFIKLKHIGDALLLTPTLTAVRARHPEAHITVVVREGTAGILAGCPAIDRILTSAAPEAHRRRGRFRRELELIRTLRREPIDFAFELGDGDRGRILAMLSGATWRCANRHATSMPWWARAGFNRVVDLEWWWLHRAEKDFQTVNACLPLGTEVPPLCFDRSRVEPWPPAARFSRFAVLHPGTRWRRKRWPVDRWIEVGRRLLGAMESVLVSSGPEEEERQQAAELCAALGPRALSTDGKTSWAQLAGLLHRASLFVGVDTAAMHLAAACGCPTVAIFGPSVEHAWSPWRVRHRLVVAPDAVLPRDTPDYFQRKGELTVEGVTVNAVWEACDTLLAEGAGSRGQPGPEGDRREFGCGR